MLRLGEDEKTTPSFRGEAIGPGKLQALTPDLVIAACEMYVSGEGLSIIARKVGCSRQSLWQLLKRRGVKMRPRLREMSDNIFFRGYQITSRERLTHNVVEVAIRHAVLNVPEKCESCQTLGKLTAHHDDYNKPLGVRWLCSKCHYDWHVSNVPERLREQCVVCAQPMPKERRRLVCSSFCGTMLTKWVPPNRKFVDIDGVIKTAAEWARESGIQASTIINRINRGWTSDRLLSPVRTRE